VVGTGLFAAMADVVLVQDGEEFARNAAPPENRTEVIS
jgi:hypothetical protein